MSFGYDRDDLGYEWGYEAPSAFSSAIRKSEKTVMADPESKAIVYRADWQRITTGDNNAKYDYWLDTSSQKSFKVPEGTKKEDLVAGKVKGTEIANPKEEMEKDNKEFPKTKPKAPGAPNPNAKTHVVKVGLPPAEASYRNALEKAGLDQKDIDIRMKVMYPSDMKEPVRNSKLKQDQDSVDKGKVDAAAINGETQDAMLKQSWEEMGKKGITDLEQRKAYLESQGFRFEDGKLDSKKPPKLIGVDHGDGKGTVPLETADREKLFSVTTQIKSTDFKGEKIKQYTQQLNDANAYLNQPPPEGRAARLSILRGMGYVDDKGNPKGDWSHEKFAGDLYEIPAKADKTPGDVPDDLSTLKPKQFNGGKTFDPDHKKDGNPDPILEGPLGDFYKKLHQDPPDFKGAKAAIANADPVTKSLGSQMLAESYAKGTHAILTKPKDQGGYGFSEEDAVAVEVSRGLRTPDGEYKKDLDPSKAESEFQRFGGFDTDGTGTLRPSRERVMTETATWFKDQNSAGMARIGMSEDDGPKYAFARGYFGDEESLPSGTLGKMREDYGNLKRVEGDKDASAKLGAEWKGVASKDGGIPSTSPGNAQFYAMKGTIRDIYQPDKKGQPDPRIQEARQQLYGADQQKKSLDPKQRELDLKQLEMEQNKEIAAKTDERERLKMKQEAQLAKERLDFDKWKADKDHELQEKQMKMQLITTVIQVLAQLVGSAMQVLGQVGAAHISGQYQVQAQILGKMGGRPG